jgi:hypothetical protein
VQGNIAEIAIALQATQGTPAASAQHRLRLSGGGLPLVREVADIEESSGDVLLDSTFVARVRLEGSPAFVARPNFAALLGYAALGAKAVTGASDPYTHTATMAAAPFTLPWLTVWTMLANGQYVRGVDCRVSVLRFESSAGGLLTITATIIGKSVTYQTSASYTTAMGAVAVETANPFIHGDATGALKVEGTAVSSISRAMVEINNGAAAQYGDSLTPDDITTARRTITVEAEQIVADFALWNRLHFGTATPTAGDVPTRTILELAGSPAGIDFKYTRPGTPARTLELLVPRLQLVTLGGLDMNTNGDPIRQTATYRAFRPGAGSPMSVVVQNSTAAYTGI